MNCPHCNKDNPDDAIHCVFCGQELSSKTTEPEKRVFHPLLRYVLAILACGGIFVLYIFLNILFGWKHGGGMVVIAVLMAALSLTWTSITSRR